MATLNNSYQYLGRSSVMTSTNGVISYYLLLYGKTSSNRDTGIHAVSVKSVLASTTTNGSYYLYKQEYNGKVNGTTAFSGTTKPNKAWELSNFVEDGVTYKLGTVLGEGTINIDCSDGLAKDITLSCYYKFGSNTATYTPSANANKTVTVTATLPAIARAATLISAQNFTDSTNPTITYSNPAGISVTSLQAAILDFTGATLINWRNISKADTSYTFHFNDAERATLLAYCAEGNTAYVKFALKTVIGGNTYYSTHITKSYSINDANPIITASVIDVNADTVALTGDSGKLIKYFSNAQATMSAEAQKGAAIGESLYIIRNGENSGYGTSHTFTGVESNEFIFSAEDSRGNIGTETITLPMVDYVKPTCNIRSNKPDGAGNMTVECNGIYFNGSFGAVENSLTVQCRYRTFGGTYGAWIDMSVTKGVNNYFASVSLEGLDYQETYFFEARITDKLTSASSRETAVKSIPVFHWGKDDFTFEVPVEAKGDVRIHGDLLIKGDENYGNTLRFGDGDYCYITEATDDVMTIRGTKINLRASGGVTVNDETLPIIKYGIWTPSLQSAVNSYTTQYGWYSKVNQSVSVGFFIKANCASGYNSTLVKISGLPFTPLFQASGGGLCSGAYVSAGCNFQCFVAETSGLITIRVQNCNNTSTQNLSTSGSGCWYPSGGGEITLSGTITFMSNS